MKFFHVYNEKYFDGLVKNNLINEDTGFKIQHIFSMPDELKFNKFAAKGTKLHSIIKEGKIPFYVDRLSGGCTYHEYTFDKDLIREYENILGKWFLGFQIHESASNVHHEWRIIKDRLKGQTGPFDVQFLKENIMSDFATLPDGTLLPDLGHFSIEEIAKLKYPMSPEELMEQMKQLYKMRMEQTLGHLLPVDSYYLATKLDDELGMQTFMPEVGCQIGQMRVAVALARGMAENRNKMWGTYYETWMSSHKYGFTMPCFNTELGNEWYLPQDQHPDDFSTYGENGGSSRLLQKRIYYYSLMSGADYLGEEWGLNCSYKEMHGDFELSDYGLAKKDFIDFAREHKTVKAHIPFAIVLPLEYETVQIDWRGTPYKIGVPRENYLGYKLDDVRRARIGHIEDVIKLFLGDREKEYGNEGHTIENSRFGDLFDIIYADESDEVLGKYEALIDASVDGDFFNEKSGKFRVFDGRDLEKLENDIKALAKEILPVYVDDLHWLISKDAEGRRYLSIFNNEGNIRDFMIGNTIDHEADRRVKVSFKDSANLNLVKYGNDEIKVEKVDDKTYFVTVPATAFAIFEY